MSPPSPLASAPSANSALNSPPPLKEAAAGGPPMRIGALAPWYGSKRTLAPKIVEELGERTGYWEPFCGSMAVLLAKPAWPMEVVNDLHGDLINLARVVASETWCPKLYERARCRLMADDFFAEAKLECLDDVEPAESVEAVNAGHVDRALVYLIYSWQGRNGVSGTGPHNRPIATRYTPGGGTGGLRWVSAVESIPAWHERLRAVHIKRGNGFEMIERVRDHRRSALYVDPPYLAKSNRYIHDFADADHDRLAELLGRFNEARVVVSYYDHPRLAELYPPGKWIRRPVPKTQVMANYSGQRVAGGAVKAPEVLLLNGPSYAPTPGGLFT